MDRGNSTNDLEIFEKAKAYYQLGICETVLSDSFLSDEANVYFGEVIRLQPKSELAKRAYARFEENILASYAGSSGVKLPEDEKETLKTLKRLAY